MTAILEKTEQFVTTLVNEKLTENHMGTLAKDIAKKIEEELEYPGQIKVTVIRESRIIEYAK